MENILDLLKENESLKAENKRFKNNEESRQKYFAAFAKAQGSFKVNAKNQEVTVCSQKDGKWTKYTYKYLTLAELIEIIRKPFAENGISFKQEIAIEYKNERFAFVIITTFFRHSSGYEDDQHSLTLPAYLEGKPKDIQNIGGVITYGKRYALQSLVGISADEDDDGNSACGNIIESKSQIKTSKPQEKQDTKNCCKCGKEIENRPLGNTTYFDYSLKELGNYYCKDCGQARKKEMETGQSQMIVA